MEIVELASFISLMQDVNFLFPIRIFVYGSPLRMVSSPFLPSSSLFRLQPPSLRLLSPSKPFGSRLFRLRSKRFLGKLLGIGPSRQMLFSLFYPHFPLSLNACSLCLSMWETINHLFLHSHFSWSLWSQFFQSIDLSCALLGKAFWLYLHVEIACSDQISRKLRIFCVHH